MAVDALRTKFEPSNSQPGASTRSFSVGSSMQAAMARSGPAAARTNGGGGGAVAAAASASAAGAATAHASAGGGGGDGVHVVLVLVLDVSASMAGSKLQATVEACEALLTTALRPEDSVCILCFHDTISVLQPTTTASSVNMRTVLRRLSTGGKTRLWESMLRGVDELEACAGDAIAAETWFEMVVVTDGNDTASASDAFITLTQRIGDSLLEHLRVTMVCIGGDAAFNRQVDTVQSCRAGTGGAGAAGDPDAVVVFKSRGTDGIAPALQDVKRALDQARLGSVEGDSDAPSPPKVQLVANTPSEMDVKLGEAAELVVRVRGNPRPTLQWYRNGEELRGETRDVFRISEFTRADAGRYLCCGWNDAGHVSSAEVRLSALTLAPRFTVQPADVTAHVGDSVSLRVEVTGAPAPTLQWFKDGAPLDGDVAPTLFLGDLRDTHQGSYVCKAHNDAGTVASNPAVVSMYPSPPVIRMTVPSSAVRYGAAFVMGVEVEGSPRPRLQWHFNGMAVHGATAKRYKIACMDETHCGTYRCVATNPSGVAKSGEVALTLQPEVPVIDWQSSSTNLVALGKPLTLKVHVRAIVAAQYQWFFNDEEIDGANADEFVIGSFAAEDAGVYRCRIWNDVGEVMSQDMEVSEHYEAPQAVYRRGKAELSFSRGRRYHGVPQAPPVVQAIGGNTVARVFRFPGSPTYVPDYPTSEAMERRAQTERSQRTKTPPRSRSVEPARTPRSTTPTSVASYGFNTTRATHESLSSSVATFGASPWGSRGASTATHRDRRGVSGTVLSPISTGMSVDDDDTFVAGGANGSSSDRRGPTVYRREGRGAAVDPVDAAVERRYTSVGGGGDRSRSVDRRATDGHSVASHGSQSTVPLPHRLRQAEEAIRERDRQLRVQEVTIRQQRDDLRYRAKRMLELERVTREQADELQYLRQELQRLKAGRR